MPVCFSFPFAATYAFAYGCEMIDSGSDVVDVLVVNVISGSSDRGMWSVDKNLPPVRAVYLVRIILPTCTVKLKGRGTYSPVEESLLLEMSTMKFTGSFRCSIFKKVFYCFIGLNVNVGALKSKLIKGAIKF